MSPVPGVAPLRETRRFGGMRNLDPRTERSTEPFRHRYQAIVVRVVSPTRFFPTWILCICFERKAPEFAHCGDPKRPYNWRRQPARLRAAPANRHRHPGCGSVLLNADCPAQSKRSLSCILHREKQRDEDRRVCDSTGTVQNTRESSNARAPRAALPGHIRRQRTGRVPVGPTRTYAHEHLYITLQISDTFAAPPCEIGALLEPMMIWQLVRVRHTQNGSASYFPPAPTVTERRTRSTRVLASSFSIMLARWDSTVRMLIPRSAAITLLESPVTTR